MYPGIGSADLRGPLPEALLARGESLTGDVSVRSWSHTVRVVAGPTRGHCTPTITPRHLSRTESMVIKCFTDTQLLSQAEVHSELMDIALKSLTKYIGQVRANIRGGGPSSLPIQ